MISKTTEFIANVKGELQKVSWPTKKEAYGSTLVVIALVLAVAVFLWGIDSILSRVIRFLLS